MDHLDSDSHHHRHNPILHHRVNQRHRPHLRRHSPNTPPTRSPTARHIASDSTRRTQQLLRHSHQSMRPTLPRRQNRPHHSQRRQLPRQATMGLQRTASHARLTRLSRNPRQHHHTRLPRTTHTQLNPKHQSHGHRQHHNHLATLPQRACTPTRRPQRHRRHSLQR